MLLIFYYLLKVILCSALLVGCYWLFLRNKVFHRYNRFYLLAAVLLSMSLPLVRIPVWQETEAPDNRAMLIIRMVTTGDEYAQQAIVDVPEQGQWTPMELLPVVYILVSGTLCLLFLYGLARIVLLINRNKKKRIGNIRLVETNAKGTPFSFFRYIFWNDRIDLETTTGQQVFRHELAHVQEKHSYDKLFINAVLLFFWCNPFYWLIRKELTMIHEFIADQEAVKDSDTSALAAMILQATYPMHRFELGNNFFNSPVKRRLVMLTKTNNPKISYLVRVIAFTLVCTTAICFTLKVKPLRAESRLATILNANPFYNPLANIAGNSGKAPVAQDTVPAPVLQSIRMKAPANPFFLNSDSVVFIGNNKKVSDQSLLIINGVKTDKSSVSDASIIAKLIKVYPANDAYAIKKYGQEARYGVIECVKAEIIRNRNLNENVDRQVAVALDKMNVMYIGVDNPVTVAVSCIPSDQLEVKMDNGSISGGNGKYIAHVQRVGEAVVHVSFRGKLLGSSIYRVKRIPDPNDKIAFSNMDFQVDYQILPKAGIDGVTSTRMKAEVLKKAKQLTAGTGYSVLGATVYFSGAGFKDVVSVSMSGDNLSLLKEQIERCTENTVITFDAIKVKDDNGKIKNIDGISLILF